ncbi:MAG: hypothetical protein RL748_4243 [Pseudomonadota bacterium]|jgi:lipoprotein NlpI
MTKKWQREVEDVAEAISNARGGCVFLIGAGCSLSAGIPLAGHFIAEIEKSFPSAFRRASDQKNYNSVMSQLTTSQRTDLLNRYIEKARINWAHLALAQMFHKQKIDRILTVNFDPLIMRACALVGDFPAIYDLATASNFNENRIAPRSVFYLNGQHTGFTTLNAKEELEQHRTRLRQIIDNTGSRRIWVVVGYSGAADPLLDILADPAIRFDSGLFWIGRSENPSDTLRSTLLEHPNKEAFYIGQQDADKFMTDLAQRLDCFPPDLLARPFDHIEGIIKNIDFSTGDMPGEALKNKLARQIALAKLHDAQDMPTPDFDWISALLEGRNQDVVNWYQQLAANAATNAVQIEPEQKQAAAWAHIQIGKGYNSAGLTLLAHSDEAQALARARARWQLAAEHFEAAQQIQPNQAAALVEWAWALSVEARALAATDLTSARAYWHMAGEKCQQALQVQPDMPGALNNWGLALAKEADALAGSDLDIARNNWQQARDKFGAALTLKADMFEAANNLGVCFNSEADALAEINLPLARRCWQLAYAQFELALSIKPGMHEALNNWGVALSSAADALADSDIDAASQNWQLASEKYRAALAIKPDLAGTLANLARTLLKQYPHMDDGAAGSGQPASSQQPLPQLLNEARELSERAEKLCPGFGAYNLACIYDLLDDADNSLAWFDKSRQVGRIYTRQYIATGQEYDEIHDHPTRQPGASSAAVVQA